MKKQNQILQVVKYYLTNRKFALLLFGSILLFTSCKQNEKAESETNDGQTITTTISSCEDKVGKYSVVASQALNAVIEKRDEQNYVLTIKMGGFVNPKFQGKCENNKLVFKIDGTDVEIIGNSFIALGFEFTKKVKNDESKSVVTEEVTEKTTDKNINEPIEIFTEEDVKTMESTNQKIVADEFVGQWEQETASEQVSKINIRYLDGGKFKIDIKELTKPSQPNEIDIKEGTYNGYLSSDNKIILSGTKYSIEKSTSYTDTPKYKYISFFVSRKPTKNNAGQGAYTEFFQRK